MNDERRLEIRRAYDRAHAIETCRSKVWYATKGDAEGDALELWDALGRILYPYQCAICELWHLSSKLLSKRQDDALRRLEAQYREMTNRPAKGNE